MDLRSKLLLDIYHCASDAGAADLNDYLLARLKQVIGFDSAVIADLGYTPETGFMISGLSMHDAPLERFLSRSQVMGQESFDAYGRLQTRDLVLQRAWAQRGRSVHVNLAELPLPADLSDYMRRYDTRHSLTFMSPQTAGPSTTMIALWRSTEKNAYDARHTHEADQLFPHVMQARRINRQLALAPVTEASKTSVALMNFQGCLHFAEQDAVRMLRREWSYWAPPMLPSELITALGQNRARLYLGSMIQVRASLQGNLLCLVISERPPLPTALSPAERRVAGLAGNGLQYKEIARELGISPATVRNQLHAVYQKLGVADRRGLIRVLGASGYVNTSG